MNGGALIKKEKQLGIAQPKSVVVVMRNARAAKVLAGMLKKLVPADRVVAWVNSPSDDPEKVLSVVSGLIRSEHDVVVVVGQGYLSGMLVNSASLINEIRRRYPTVVKVLLLLAPREPVTPCFPFREHAAIFWDRRRNRDASKIVRELFADIQRGF